MLAFQPKDTKRLIAAALGNVENDLAIEGAASSTYLQKNSWKQLSTSATGLYPMWNITKEFGTAFKAAITAERNFVSGLH